MTRQDIKKWLKWGDVTAACNRAGVKKDMATRWLNGTNTGSVVGAYLEEIAKARKVEAQKLAKERVSIRK